MFSILSSHKVFAFERIQAVIAKLFFPLISTCKTLWERYQREWFMSYIYFELNSIFFSHYRWPMMWWFCDFNLPQQLSSKLETQEMAKLDPCIDETSTNANMVLWRSSHHGPGAPCRRWRQPKFNSLCKKKKKKKEKFKISIWEVHTIWEVD